MYIKTLGKVNMTTRNYKPEWIREDFIDFIAEKFDAIWAYKKVKAQLVTQRQIGQEFYELSFQPNHNFNAQQYIPGQCVLVTVVHAGVRHQRSYSIMEINPQGHVVIAVKKQGKVSNVLSQLRQGDIVELSQPQGDFALTSTLDQPVLLLASGSGITSIFALLKQLASQNRIVDLIYFSRDDAYYSQIKALIEKSKNLNFHAVNTLKTPMHLSKELLQHMVPNYVERETYACGANAMMQSIQQIFAEQGLLDQLKTEFFQLQVDVTVEAQAVTFSLAQQDFMATGNLLESAERAGLKPAHGCRMGICNTCSCTKQQGSVKNLLTGEIDHANNTQIKLCISQAISPVRIQL